MNPVVRVAQMETQLDLPVELDIPWSYLQRTFGITSPSGNIMSNVICNLDKNGQLAYSISEGMPAVVQRTEFEWCRLFHECEYMVCRC